ncbi:MAG: hypothetical protein WBO06_12115 [Gammaproteobacteria bacterium]
MHRSNSKLATYFLAALLAVSNIMFASTAVAAPYNQVNSKPSGGAMLADTFLVRPAMLVGTAVGVVTFIVTLPFSALGMNVDEAAKTLVLEPAEYTFLRPLGEL